MNRDNVLRAANYIESLEKGSLIPDKSEKTFKFHMGLYEEINNEGAIIRGCISGAICHMNGVYLRDYYLINSYAKKYLGLGKHEGVGLFAPPRFVFSWWSNIQPHEAATVLRNLAYTGKVDWTIVRGESFFSKIKNLMAAPNYKAVLTAGLFRN